MGKISLTVFHEDCMGCHACEVACKQEHGPGTGARLIKVLERSPSFIPIYCHHCARPPCQEACPVQAIYRNERGIVLIDAGRCIGCKDCVEACPFAAMQFNDENEVAAKCDLCLARLDRSAEPACSRACPTRCIFWGDTASLTEALEGRVLRGKAHS